jgi:hypothetical protein
VPPTFALLFARHARRDEAGPQAVGDVDGHLPTCPPCRHEPQNTGRVLLGNRLNGLAAKVESIVNPPEGNVVIGCSAIAIAPGLA